jgi:hypothetical protein
VIRICALVGCGVLATVPFWELNVNILTQGVNAGLNGFLRTKEFQKTVAQGLLGSDNPNPAATKGVFGFLRELLYPPSTSVGTVTNLLTNLHSTNSSPAQPPLFPFAARFFGSSFINFIPQAVSSSVSQILQSTKSFTPLYITSILCNFSVLKEREEG